MPTENSEPELEVEPEISEEERLARKNEMLCRFRAEITPGLERMVDRYVESVEERERIQRRKDTVVVIAGTLLVAIALTWTLLRM